MMDETRSMMFLSIVLGVWDVKFLWQKNIDIADKK